MKRMNRRQMEMNRSVDGLVRVAGCSARRILWAVFLAVPMLMAVYLLLVFFGFFISGNGVGNGLAE